LYYVFQGALRREICTRRQLWNIRILCQYPGVCGPVYVDWYQGSASGNDCSKPGRCLCLPENPQRNVAAQMLNAPKEKPSLFTAVSAEKDLGASDDFGSIEHWPHSDQFLLCGKASAVRDQ